MSQVFLSVTVSFRDFFGLLTVVLVSLSFVVIAFALL